MKKEFFIWFFWYPLLGFTQTDSLVLVKKKILIRQDIVRFDTVSVWPFDIQLFENNLPVEDNLWGVNAVQAVIRWKAGKYPHDSVTVKYWRYPAQWYEPVINIPEIKVFKTKDYPSSSPPDKSNPFGGLQTEGYWEKGAMSGNRMNASSQNMLNLNIQGEWAPGIRVSAHIRDDNLPYGYQGISTPVKDINRIYIAVTSRHWHVFGGDSLWHFKSPLLAFDRDNKGIGFGIRNDNRSFDFKAATVKGKFGREVYTLQTAQYGPFTLRSTATDYIYILHGSEKIYLNGKKLTPGQYSIDYGTGEVRLNPSLDIKAYDRLVIEYQYANTFYRRWSGFSTFQNKGEHSVVRLFLFNETDMPGQSLFYKPDTTAVNLLKQTAEPENMFFTAAQPVDWDDNKILYIRITSGNTDYFRYAPAPVQEQLYEVRFRYVGSGKGEYKIEQITAKGKIMRYTGPGQGDYTPLFPLQAPLNNQLAGMEWNYTDSLISSANQAVINRFNPNMFFPGKSNVKYSLAFRSRTDWTIFNKNGKKFQTGYEIRQLPSHYHPGDRLFNPDFENDWDITQAQTGKHRFYALHMDYTKNNNHILIRPAYLQLRDSIRLWHTEIHHDYKQKHWFLSGKHFWLQGQKNAQTKALYFGSQTQLQYKSEHWTPGIKLDFKKRSDQHLNLPDTLNYAYIRMEPELIYQKKHDRLSLQFGQTGIDSVRSGKFTKVALQKQWRINWQHKQKNGKSSLTFGYLTDPYHPSKKQWLAVISVDWSDPRKISPVKISFARYADQMAVREVVYTRVPDGQGQYQWIDYNGNGQEDPGEFEPAYYSDQANYIRVLLPSLQYKESYRTTARILWTLQPGQSNKKTFWKNWKNRLQIDMDMQHPDNDLKMVFLPAQNWLGGHRQINNLWTWHFLPSWKFDYTFSLQQTGENLYFGSRRNFNRLHQWQLNKKLSAFWHAGALFKRSTITHFEDEFPQKNYHLEKIEYGLPFNFKNKDFSAQLLWTGTVTVALYSPENLHAQSWLVRLQYRHRKNQWLFTGTYIRNNFKGNPHSPAAFVMLQGLKPGKNYTQNVNWQYQLRKNIRLIFQYNLRISENSPAVHTGQIKLRMDF